MPRPISAAISSAPLTAEIACQRCQCGIEHAPVGGAQPDDKARLAVFANFAGVAEEQRSQHRRNGDRHQQRGEQGNDVGQPERHHQPALDTGEEEQRHEHQHDDQRGEDDRALDFLGREKDHMHRRFALALGFGVVLPQAAHDVLDHDDRVVDQRAECDGDAAQRHGVDCRAERLHRQNGGNQRERQRDQRDRRRAHRDQEGEDDGDDENRPVAQRGHQVGDGGLDEIGLAEQPVLDLHAGRQRLLDVGDGGSSVRVSSSVLAEGWRWMPSTTAGLPLVEPTPRTTAVPSATSAT
jgi:hypothetical protein